MPVAAALPYITAATSVAGVANSISAGRKAQSAAKDAALRQEQLVANLKYEPINIEKLRQDARDQAIANATQSLALERELSPAVAATRQMAAERIRSDLALGGQLSPDVANQVARAARTSGSLSGAPAGPLTAAQIGTTAEALKQQRLSNAAGLLATNPLPVAGIDPGALASLQISQNAAMNQFNAAKAGINANMIQSQGQLAGGAAGLQAGINANLLNKAPGILEQIGNLPVFQNSPYGNISVSNTAGINTNPAVSSILDTGTLGLGQMKGDLGTLGLGQMTGGLSMPSFGGNINYGSPIPGAVIPTGGP